MVLNWRARALCRRPVIDSASRAPAVAEALSAAFDHPDRFRVVAVLAVDLTGQRGANQLDAFDRCGAGEPANDRPLARSFKTLAARPGFWKPIRLEVEYDYRA